MVHLRSSPARAIAPVTCSYSAFCSSCPQALAPQLVTVGDGHVRLIHQAETLVAGHTGGMASWEPCRTLRCLSLRIGSLSLRAVPTVMTWRRPRSARRVVAWRRLMAGVRTPLQGACGRRALDQADSGAGEATSAHAPVRPPSREPTCTRPPGRPSLTIFRPPPVRSWGPGGLWHARARSPFTRGKATFSMISLVSERSARQPCWTVTRQMTRLPRTAGGPAGPGLTVTAGQRRNIPAGVNRD